VRRWCLIPPPNTTRFTLRKKHLIPRGPDSRSEGALTARLERLVGPPGAHPLPIVVELVAGRRRCTNITRQRNWSAQ